MSTSRCTCRASLDMVAQRGVRTHQTVVRHTGHSARSSAPCTQPQRTTTTQPRTCDSPFNHKSTQGFADRRVAEPPTDHDPWLFVNGCERFSIIAALNEHNRFVHSPKYFYLASFLRFAQRAFMRAACALRCVAVNVLRPLFRAVPLEADRIATI
jgi:hypothetical protein